MNVLPLPRGAFRPKALSCMDDYLSLSPHHSLSVCLYYEGQAYYFGNGGNPESLQYDLGSLSKTVSAHLILALAQKGHLDINATVDCYLPLPKGHYPSLYRLLTHTAGYGPLTPWELTLPALLRRPYVYANPYQACDSAKVLSCLGRRKRKKKSRYAYSDFSYAVLALVAQEVTKTPFHRLLEEFLHRDLGLCDTHLQAEETKRRPLAIHKGKPIPFWRWQEDCPYLASGGLISTPADVLRYMRLELESNHSFILAAQEPCRELCGKIKGLLPCVGWRSYENSHRLWHVGGVGTFRSSVILNRNKQFGVAVLGNAKGKNRANVHHLAKLLYSEWKAKKIQFPKKRKGLSLMKASVRNTIEKWYRTLFFPKEFDREFYEALDCIPVEETATINDYDLQCKDGKRNLLHALYFCEQTQERYMQAGLPEDVLLQSLEDLVIWCKVWSGLKGQLYLGQMDWLIYTLDCRLFRIGRLQFCPEPSSHGLASVGLKKGAPILNIHIPAAGPLTQEEVSLSLCAAKEFFSRHFPDHNYQHFVCHSWLLDEGLRHCLPPSSNILAFGDRFVRGESRESYSLLRYIFRWDATKENLAELPVPSSFAQRVKDAVTEGKKFYATFGAIKKEDV